MIGTKRRNVSLRSEAEEASFQSKRITGESLIHGLGAEPSQLQVAAAPALDLHRAESSRQHVRALNTQFASWVQSQLQNHPDELWDDGVKDYLAHASSILEKFSDVVNWLKANAANSASLPTLGTQNVEKIIAPETRSNEAKLLPLKSVFGAPNTSPGFAISWSSGASSNSQPLTLGTAAAFAPLWSSGGSCNSQASSLSAVASPANSLSSGVFSSSLTSSVTATTSSGTSWNTGAFSISQTPFKFGSQSTAVLNDDATEDADGENEEQPSSPSVKRTEEKGIVVVHEVKCKLFVKHDYAKKSAQQEHSLINDSAGSASSDPADKDPWKDKGTGQLTIKCKEGVSKGTKDSKPTIVIRNDVGKILLNALLYPGIKTILQKKNTIVAIFHTSSDSGNNDVVARTFLIRTKNEEDRNKLAEAIQEYAPAA